MHWRSPAETGGVLERQSGRGTLRPTHRPQVPTRPNPPGHRVDDLPWNQYIVKLVGIKEVVPEPAEAVRWGNVGVSLVLVKV